MTSTRPIVQVPSAVSAVPGSAWAVDRTVGGPLGDRAHVWAATLDVSDSRHAALEALLSDDERRRAERYRVDIVARRYVSGRGVLRELLASYLGIAPRDVQLCYEQHGKPALDLARHAAGPRFNVTHAEGLALFAFAERVRVGIDVERVAPFADMASVAESCFSHAERQALARVAASEVAEAFFSIWTRKEAYLKANGTGLMTPLDSFDVSVGRRVPAALLRVGADAGAASRWSVVHLEPADDFMGALALDRVPTEVICRQWAH